MYQKSHLHSTLVRFYVSPSTIRHPQAKDIYIPHWLDSMCVEYVLEGIKEVYLHSTLVRFYVYHEKTLNKYYHYLHSTLVRFYARTGRGICTDC